ncbi:MAG: Gfo/Idh/MocA family oxidoreductase [Planctomycetota bacterium]|nr:Gfo/Idh/MocA family oxidoreductase [Planctomycetota bacterium]
MEKVRFGFLGAGISMRYLYGPYMKLLENGRAYAVCDVDKQRADVARAKWGIEKAYYDYDQMLKDPQIDFVVIAVPTNYHKDMVLKAAAAGKHVFCEKPMCVTVDEADEMIAACKKANVKLMVAFMKRFNSSFCKAKEIIDSGALGDVFELRVTWDNARATSSAQSDYRHRLTSGGGYLQEDGSHPIDICRWWMGDVAEVNGYVMCIGKDRFENEDVSCVAMRHKNNTLSTLHITMLTHCTGEERYEVFGTKATLVMRCIYHSSLTQEHHHIHLYEKSKTVTDLTMPNLWFEYDDTESYVKKTWQYLRELEHFCECILRDVDPQMTGEDGRAIVEIVNAAYLSAYRKQRVVLPITGKPDFAKLFENARAETPQMKIGAEPWVSRY